MFAGPEKQTAPNNIANNMSQEARNKADGVLRDVRQGVEGLGEDLQRAANNAGTVVRDVTEKAVAETSRATHDVISYVRANPIQSSLLTMGAGIIIGALMHRK